MNAKVKTAGAFEAISIDGGKRRIQPASTPLPALILSAALLLAFATGAGAAGSASLEMLGFSDDGRHFAVLQSGTEDGSGEVFADLLVAEPARDGQRDVTTPLKAQGSGGDMDTWAQAASILDPLGFSADLYLGSGEEFEMPLPAGSSATLSITGGIAVNVDLSPFPAQVPDCAGKDGAVMGLDLAISIDGQGAVNVRREPDAEGIGCSLAFKLVRVAVAPRADGGLSVAVVVAYQRIGFEGPDLRYFIVSRVL